MSTAHDIAQHLYKISAQTGDSFFKLFDDWLALMVAALSRQPGNDDERYMTIMRTYGPRIPGKEHPGDHFAKAMGALFHACQAESALNGTFPDYLGRIYEEEALGNTYAGQFFTPEHLCTVMAQMTIEPTNEPVSIADPACGSGRFFIAAMPLAPNATFTGTDRDLTCVHMTALNLLLRNANGFVVHGNTLSLETWGGYATESTALGGQLRVLGAGVTRVILTQTAEALKGQQPQVIPESAPADEPEPTDQAAPAFTENKKGQFGFDF